MRHKTKIKKPSTKLTIYQKSVYYSRIKIYMKFLDIITELSSNKKYF